MYSSSRGGFAEGAAARPAAAAAGREAAPPHHTRGPTAACLVQQRKVETLDQVRVRHVTAQVL